MLISLLNKLQKAREGWGLLTIFGTPVSTEGTLSHSILSQVFHSYQFKTMVLGPLTRRFLAGWCELSLNETDFHRPEPPRFRSSKSSRSDGRREAKKTKRIKKTRSTFCGFAGWLRSYETQRRSYCPRLAPPFTIFDFSPNIHRPNGGVGWGEIVGLRLQRTFGRCSYWRVSQSWFLYWLDSRWKFWLYISSPRFSMTSAVDSLSRHIYIFIIHQFLTLCILCIDEEMAKQIDNERQGYTKH